MLDGGRAHAPVLATLAGIPARARGVRVPKLPHSAWELLEHMRLAQADILAFARDPDHESGRFPDDLWPASPAPPDARAWNRSCAALRADLRTLRAIIGNRRVDLLAPIPHAGVSWLHELVILGNHNSYHAGQLVLLRRALGVW